MKITETDNKKAQMMLESIDRIVQKRILYSAKVYTHSVVIFFDHDKQANKLSFFSFFTCLRFTLC